MSSAQFLTADCADVRRFSPLHFLTTKDAKDTKGRRVLSTLNRQL